MVGQVGTYCAMGPWVGKGITGSELDKYPYRVPVAGGRRQTPSVLPADGKGDRLIGLIHREVCNLQVVAPERGEAQ